ncbi:MAG: alpha-amylase family glycosyl hydrolase, partial [Lacipirellulaceae bacterium]
MLQIFEARWETVEDRMADIFELGYGRLWIPPTSRADSGDQSVGYDVYDRFDLGQARRPTAYGTETSLKRMVGAAHGASVDVYADLILNHAGFSDLTTVDDFGTTSTADDVTFAEAGGYPGLAITLPNDIDGDFHGAFETGDLNFRLSGLVDIAQEKNHQFIRTPVNAGDPNNIPAGTAAAFGRIANVPNPNNARFYPDQDLGGTQFDVDPGPGEFLITRYDFNRANPLAGDATIETAEQMLMRHAQWMIQEVGVDGFRLDAVKHFPTNTLTIFDQAVYKTNDRLQHDGSYKPVYSFGEVLDGNRAFVQTFINSNLPNPSAIDANDFEVKGNRDALDFPLFFALRSNLTGNGLGNNWHAIRSASQDLHDDGLHNGSQGVSFVDSHDNLSGGFPFLKNVAYAYTLMRPGNALVYFNAEEFGPGRDFPNDGK